MEYLKSNLYEIKKSGSLQTLGGLLALFHLLQFFLWWSHNSLPVHFVEQGLPMCWSMFEDCGWLNFIPVGALRVIFYSYGVTSLLAALLFILTRFSGTAFTFLLFTAIFGILLYIQDLRLSSNDGYFVALLTWSYLFLPSKHRLMRWTIASFFVALGFAQSSPDWLTGNWFVARMAIPIKFAEWLAAISLLTQMIGGAALVFRDGRYFWTGWGFLFIYHCAHLYVGEVLGSALSLGALMYVASDELELRKAEREYIYQSFIRPEPSFLWGGIVLGIFWLAQLAPSLPYVSKTSIGNILEPLILHPEAAHEDCTQRTYAIFKDRIEEIEVTPQVKRQDSMTCNRYMRFLDLKAVCNKMKNEHADFVTLSSALQVRNFRDKNSQRAFEVQDFCADELTYKRLSEVKWNISLAP